MKKARWLGSSSPFSCADLIQTGLLHHPKAGLLGALEALGALSRHFHVADRSGAEAHGGDLLSLGIAGHISFLCCLQGADQGLFLDGHRFLHSLEVSSNRKTRSTNASAVPNEKGAFGVALGSTATREINNLGNAGQVRKDNYS